MDEEINIMIAGGGTGGHLYPALAIGEEIMKQTNKVKVHYIGSEFGLEAKILSNKGLSHTLLPISGFQRSLSINSILKNLALCVRIPISIKKIKSLFDKMDPKVVIGTGGYASAIPVKIGIKRNIPTMIQEQNSYPGLTTRLFAKKATTVFAGSEDSKFYLDTKINVTGNPTRNGIEKGSKESGFDTFQLNSSLQTIFLFGGSQGSVPLNKAIYSILNIFEENNIQLLWQTGEKNYKRLKHLETEKIKIKPYIKEMNLAYAISDLVISRAGALTLSELLVCGMPSILLPLPTATADHQAKNAKTIVQAGAAIMIDQHNMDNNILKNTILELINDKDKLSKMRKNAFQLAKPNATNNIVKNILEVAQV